MNCLEFRRRCIAEPDCREGDYLEHKAECNSCHTLSVEIDQFDRSLASAIKVQPPSDLASRIMLKQSMLLEKSRHRFNYGMYAMAASVLIMIGITFGFYTSQKPTLDQAVIAYVTQHLQDSQKATSINEDQLRQLFKSVGLQLNDDLGVVALAERCYVNDTESLHIVLQGEKGPITILIMPHNQLAIQTIVANDYFTGIITPCPKGSLAILGGPGEELESIRQHIQSLVIW